FSATFFTASWIVLNSFAFSSASRRALAFSSACAFTLYSLSSLAISIRSFSISS
ncbi:putative membrane protein, partial [Vibrio harveyi]